MKAFLLILILVYAPGFLNAQNTITKSIKDFGAVGNGISDDQDAFVKASQFFNKRNGHGKLIIPKGVYIVGRQKFTGDDVKKNTPSYTGEYALDLRNCSDLIIEGATGAVLKFRKGLRIGAFSPITGEPFKQAIKDINMKPAYGHYASTVGIMIYFSGCSNIKISGLKLDGNFDQFILGGNWGNGRNAFEMIHYGIYLIDTHDVYVSGCNIEKFACDGIYIANLGQEVKTYQIKIDRCKVNYCGRNGLSWIGGQGIRVSNSVFSNSGQGLIHESPAAGISIEVENNSFCRDGYFYNCEMINNIGSGITSGSAGHSDHVLFKSCTAASPVYYTVFADAAAHVFEDCKFYGTVLVWYKSPNKKDAVKFKRCLFDENYNGKKMYDGTYQLGAEATAVLVDSCIFKAYTTSNYYLNGLTNDCSLNNDQKIVVSNSQFFNYSKGGFKLGLNIAGIGRHTVFYNNKFYAEPGIDFLNGFKDQCNADAGKNQFLSNQKK